MLIQKFMLPQQSNKAQRVCDACYERLRFATVSDADVDADASLRSGNKLNADSSNDDDTDEDTASPAPDAQHDEPRFYGDNSMMSTHDDSTTGTGNFTANPTPATATASNNCWTNENNSLEIGKLDNWKRNAKLDYFWYFKIIQ